MASHYKDENAMFAKYGVADSDLSFSSTNDGGSTDCQGKITK